MQLPQSTVWSLGVVVFPPIFDQYLRLAEAVEYLTVEQLIAEPGVEALPRDVPSLVY